MARKAEGKKNSRSKPAPPVKEISGDGSPAEMAEEPTHGTNTGGFFIVGIGASAGGLEALEQFFPPMPHDSGMAFILVLHLDPTHKSIMRELLQKYTPMEISEVENGMQVEPNRVYIIPPNKDMAIMNRRLQLLEPVERRGLRHPIDFFFRSLAQDLQERAIGVVLSGTGTEGTLGLKAIKGEGGLAIAQDPEDARYGGMPGSAIADGLVDYVLPAGKIAEQLSRFIKSSLIRPPRVPQKSEGRTDHLQKIFVLIRAQTGHDFSLYKQNTILRRIERRMTLHQIEDLSSYTLYLRENPHEVEALFRELLIRVTNFFRDPVAFEVLKKEVIPHLLRNKSYDTPVRIWVPGCSTGEEAYSLAILFREHMQEIAKNYKIQIFATDIDSGAIETARSGAYPDSITVDVTPERLSRFFLKQDVTFRIKDDIREMVVFAVQNLIKDPPFSKLDLISCRNLLIYLGTELQKKVIPLFRYALNPDGILFLGSSETIGDYSDMFSVFDKKWRIYKASRTSSLPPLPIDTRPAAPPEKGSKEKGFEGKKPWDMSVGELAERFLLELYAPPCAIVNERGDILYLHGRTGKYLEPAPGKASLNVLTMAREGLQLDLRTALRKAVARKEDIVSEGLRVRTNGDFQTINLVIHYIRKPEYLQGLLMVVFIDVPSPGKVTLPPDGCEEKVNQRVLELEFEVKSTREHLQTTIEELETSNEELKSANEELQSSNEELQSTNEELETSKEELQSVNEELLTVNAELQTKIEELSQVNSDMSNLLSSTQVATVFLNNELRIKRYTPGAVGIINLIQTDAGRPMGDVSSKLAYPELVRDAEEVLRTLVTKEKMVSHTEGKWFTVRIMPYRTKENVIDGVVITFIDVTTLKKRRRHWKTPSLLRRVLPRRCGNPSSSSMENCVSSWRTDPSTRLSAQPPRRPKTSVSTTSATASGTSRISGSCSKRSCQKTPASGTLWWSTISRPSGGRGCCSTPTGWSSGAAAPP